MTSRRVEETQTLSSRKSMKNSLERSFTSALIALARGKRHTEYLNIFMSLLLLFTSCRFYAIQHNFKAADCISGRAVVHVRVDTAAQLSHLVRATLTQTLGPRVQIRHGPVARAVRWRQGHRLKQKLFCSSTLISHLDHGVTSPFSTTTIVCVPGAAAKPLSCINGNSVWS